MLSQILLAPALAVLNVSTGVTPGRLFQITTKRSSGHALANCKKFLLAGEGLEGVGGRSSGFLGGSERADVVFCINGEGHLKSPLFRCLCGHNINHSKVL